MENFLESHGWSSYGREREDGAGWIPAVDLCTKEVAEDLMTRAERTSSIAERFSKTLGMEVKVFSPCKEELKPAIERFIRYRFPDWGFQGELCIVDETSPDKVRDFWKHIRDIRDTDLHRIPPILFITFPGSEQGSMDFIRHVVKRWERWEPCSDIPLSYVLESLMEVE